MKKQEVKILEISKKTENISEFVLGFSENFEFQNGQFLTIDIPHKKNIEKKIEKNGKEKIEKITKNIFLKRAYSIVDFQFDEKNNFGEFSDGEKIFGKIILWIKNVNGIGTKFLFSRKIGEKLNISGNFGNFFVKGEKENLIFLATGIGIPPIISHLKFIFEKNKKIFENKKIFLAYGIREKSDFFFENILEKFSKENKNFSYKIFFSGESEKISEENKNFKSGYCTKIFEEDEIDFKKTEFYFCGSVPLMKEIGGILEKKGVEKKDFIFEAY